MKRWLLGAALLVILQSVWAGEEAKLPTVELRGDAEALKRGAGIVINVCLTCHSLKYFKYRDLLKVGFSKDQLDELRGAKSMDDVFASVLDAEAAKNSFGAVPPDLSLMAKARAGGKTYVYAFLLGFYIPAKGGTDNHFFPGVKMPDVLGIGTASAAERGAIEGQAKDIAVFLEWASDPNAQERRTLGYYVIAYLAVLTALLYLWKRRIWQRLD